MVIGLGRFGQAVSLELARGGIEVLAIDSDERIVQSLAGKLTHVVAADSTDPEALRQLAVDEATRVVVSIGSDIEANMLTASVVVEMGVPTIWAKAMSEAHAKILHQIGVHNVVRPEHDMGTRVAHLLRGRMRDYIEFDDDFAMIKTGVPASCEGRTLEELRLRSTHRVTITAVKRPGGRFQPVTLDTRIEHGDIVLASGLIADVERFSIAP